MIFVPVTRYDEATRAICYDCDKTIIERNQYWSLSKSVALHASNGKCPNYRNGRVLIDRRQRYHPEPRGIKLSRPLR